MGCKFLYGVLDMKCNRLGFYVGITSNRKIVCGCIVIVVKWMDEEEIIVVFPDEINSRGWNKVIIPKIEYVVAREQRNLKLKDEEIEIVIPNIYISYSSIYKTRYSRFNDITKAADELAEQKRLWLLDTVYADSYPLYKLRDNLGKLDIDLALTILDKGITRMFIIKRLSKIGFYYEEALRRLNKKALFTDYTGSNIPVWWLEEFKGRRFCNDEGVIEGGYLPIRFRRWARKMGINISRAKKEEYNNSQSIEDEHLLTQGERYERRRRKRKGRTTERGSGR